MARTFSLPKNGGIRLDNVPESIIHACDKIYTTNYPSAADAAKEIAEKISLAVNDCKGIFKLGFSSGTSIIPVFDELRKFNEQGKLSFANVEIFLTDEYYKGNVTAEELRNRYLKERLLKYIDVKPENVHLPDPTLGKEQVMKFCNDFNEMCSDLDLLVIGVGEEGQVGFNEAGTEQYSRTRAVMLSYNSRKRQAANFGGDLASTPNMAITMGVGTMLTAKKVYITAWGESKATVVHRMVEQKADLDCPASLFQNHRNVHMFVDDDAASLLTRQVAPWLLGPCDWTPKFCRKAVIWLSQKVGKPILELSQKDYLANSLDELLEVKGPYDKINIEIFNDLQHTVSGWPGGKPDADDSTRPVKSKPFPKRVLIFSPHPDDDVISMGGTFIRLVHQGHDVHVAYQTSGDVAVHDDVVMQHMDAAALLGFENKVDYVRGLIESKHPGAPEPKELLAIKAAIRQSEARGADHSFGMKDDHIHFLALPFYESGGIKKLPCTQVDIDIIKNLMKEIKPDQIYMAGDLADPHGTHRVCTEGAMEALAQLKEEGESWTKDCTVWLYRGAWMEWELGSVDMAVPISPAEVIEKRHAIFHHLSQKDIVPFPGDDSREFWQRAEDRTQNTARQYSDLGIATYQAMEVFVKF